MVATNSRKALGTSRSTSFQHEQLDYRKGAIRLLRILPRLSDDGHIQCEMWHGSVKANYTCLSYVWGSANTQRQILVNGRLLLVRENLYDFMRSARSRHANPPRTFWIDALCIDQNSVYEKNHQVAQMGLIYSNAVEVVSWLGHGRAISSAFAKYIGVKPDPEFNFRRDWLEVIRNPYWKRSWITQEILLARRLTLWACDFEVDSRKINDLYYSLEAINPTGNFRRAEQWHPDVFLFSTYLQAMTGWTDLRNQSLINLFHTLPSRESEKPRDRIYSLFSIASDSASIPVDYGCSDADVFLDVLGALHKSMCVCFWSFMVETMEYQAKSSSKPGSVHLAPILELPIRAVTAEFFSGPELADWHVMCSTCRARLPDIDPDRRGHLFCLNEFAHAVNPECISI